jgi:GntR family transcriptional regulator
MRVEVEPSSTSPLYRQIADQIRGGIARGEVVAGQRLPVARDLATDLGVNLQTVLRAYAALRDEGLVEVRRRRGVTVIAAPEQADLAGNARELVALARRFGLGDDAIRRLVEVHL